MLKKRNLILSGAAAILIAGADVHAADWPQWRGIDREDRSPETGLLQSWPEGGPKLAWISKEAGIGYSGPAVVDGKLYTLGGGRDGIERLIAMNAANGEVFWTTDVGTLLQNNWGDGPRSTPSVDDGHVYALGGRGDLICVTAADGKQVWQRSMEDLGGEVPNWGYTESPLVDGDKILVTPGGSQGAIAALDKKTGKTVWQSKDFTDPAHYSSIIAADHNGVRQYIQLTEKHVVGVNGSNGDVLWTSDWPGRVAVIPTPIFHDGYVYVTSEYGVGCKLIRIGANNRVEEIYDNKVMENHHGGVVRVGEHLYGHSKNGGWTCQDFKSGEAVWASSELGKGAVSYADNRLYCVEENTGTVVLAAASPDGWKEHGRFTLEPQSEQRARRGKVWTHPVVSGGKLYLRDQELVYCFDIKQ